MNAATLQTPPFRHEAPTTPALDIAESVLFAGLIAVICCAFLARGR
jgi:hypothetical protein